MILKYEKGRLARNSFVLLVTLSSALCALAKDKESPRVEIFWTDNSLTNNISAHPVRQQIQAPFTCATNEGVFRVDTNQRFQTMAGVGAAFSEIGCLAFLNSSKKTQKEILTALFDSREGAGFSLCRFPVGSSDFATNAYSYCDTSNDYGMKSFSLKRDEQSVIPVARAARKVNPELQFFASPWSPPGWMKLTGKMDGGGATNVNTLRDDDRIYAAYALYFAKYVTGYKSHGLPIARICPQNEMDYSPKYPGCVMPPPDMIRLVTQHLAPRFKADSISTEIWPGTFREGRRQTFAMDCLKNDAFRADIPGIGIQYYRTNAVASLRQAFPSVRLMHTEAPDGTGKNISGITRMPEMIEIFNSGCENYAYWNMMLDERQRSGWNLGNTHQDSLLTIDRQAKTVRYNEDFQPVYLISKFVRPGVVRVASDFEPAVDSRFNPPVCAFVAKDGTILILTQNRGEMPVTVEVNIDATAIPVRLPAHADCVVTVKSAANFANAGGLR